MGNKRNPRFMAVAIVAAVSLLMAGCGDDDGEGGGGGGGDGGSGGVTVGLALPGPKNDQGFNEAHFNGITKAEQDLGIVPSVQENIVDPAARIDALRNLAADNELVIGVGAEFAEAGLTIAPQFPDVEFMIINGETDPNSPNLHVYGVRQGVPAYIAGVLSASLPDLDVTKIGFVGGEEIPPTTQSDDGLRAAVETTDQSIEYVSTIVGDFNDAPEAKDAAAAQIASGTQVIFGLVDAGFPGVIQAAEEAGGETRLFSVIFPRCDDYPNLMGTAYLNSDVLVETMVSDFIDETIPDEPRFFGVEDPNIQRLELCPNFDTPELRQIVDDTTREINEGTIELPEGV